MTPEELRLELWSLENNINDMAEEWPNKYNNHTNHREGMAAGRRYLGAINEYNKKLQDARK